MQKDVGGFCDFLYDDSFYETFQDFQMNVDNKFKWKTCPWPKGKYTLTNFSYKNTDFLPAYLPGNEKWKFDLEYWKDGKHEGGFVLYVILRNEQSLLMGG